MATTRAPKRKGSTRSAGKAVSRRKVRRGGGVVCPVPFCGRVQAQYRRATIRLTSVDLFDARKKVWLRVPVNMLNPRGLAAARRALRAAAVAATIDIPCINIGCECRLSGKWGPWTRWARVPIHGGFSIAAPNPPPAQLRYRANGTVMARYRLQPGTCYRIAA